MATDAIAGEQRSVQKGWWRSLVDRLNSDKLETLHKAALVFLLVILAEIAWIALAGPETNAGFRDSAAVIAFIGAVALGIERVIEVIWLVVGNLKGTYWPLTKVSKQVEEMVEELNTALTSFHEDLTTKLETVDQLADAKLARVEIDKLKKRFDDLAAVAKQAPDNQRVQLVVSSAAQMVSYLEMKYDSKVEPRLVHTSAVAKTAINGVQDFLVTFKDNPGRRLISLCIGTVLGLAIAGIFGLDLLQAALVDPVDATQASQGTGEAARPASHPRLNIIITGLIIGLGSSPTHEVIRAIQEYKKRRKGENISRPDLPTD